jgi:hypothetical protein
VESNTFYTLSRSLLHLEAVPRIDDATQFRLTGNLFVDVAALARPQEKLDASLAPRLFASSSGNVCHEDSCRNVEVAFLQAQAVKFDLSELPLAVTDPNFLMYARHSPLTSAAPGGRAVGVPPGKAF